jgi:hypothetical protein
VVAGPVVVVVTALVRERGGGWVVIVGSVVGR